MSIPVRAIRFRPLNRVLLLLMVMGSTAAMALTPLQPVHPVRWKVLRAENIFYGIPERIEHIQWIEMANGTWEGRKATENDGSSRCYATIKVIHQIYTEDQQERALESVRVLCGYGIEIGKPQIYFLGTRKIDRDGLASYPFSAESNGAEQALHLPEVLTTATERKQKEAEGKDPLMKQ